MIDLAFWPIAISNKLQNSGHLKSNDGSFLAYTVYQLNIGVFNRLELKQWI